MTADPIEFSFSWLEAEALLLGVLELRQSLDRLLGRAWQHDDQVIDAPDLLLLLVRDRPARSSGTGRST
jgi:hypothetical protein